MKTLIAILLMLASMTSVPAQAPSPVPQPTPTPVPPTPTPSPLPAPTKPLPVASIKVPAGVVYAGTLVVLDGSASIGDSIDWEPVAPADFSAFQIDSNGLTLVFASDQPGIYTFRVVAESVIDGKIVRSKQRVSVPTIARTPPTPVVPPNPSPIPPAPTPPAPTALPKGFYATLVTDATTLTPALADARDSFTLAGSPIQSAIVALGGQPRTVDSGSSEYVRRNLAPFLARPSDGTGDPVTVPALVIQDATGKVIARKASPADAAGIVSILKTLGGQ